MTIQVFEGVPSSYNTQKRMVVPAALRVLKLKPGRRVSIDLVVAGGWQCVWIHLVLLCFTVCVVRRLSHEVGWKYKVREVMKAGVGVVYEDRVTCETGLVFCVC